jgi:hypothetical protein
VIGPELGHGVREGGQGAVIANRPWAKESLDR